MTVESDRFILRHDDVPEHVTGDWFADNLTGTPGPANVFSLAKTLWVICDAQRRPPQGEQQASNESYTIDKYRVHPLSHRPLPNIMIKSDQIHTLGH